MTFKRPVSWIWLFVVFTTIGILFTLHSYLDDPGSSLAAHFYYEMTGAWAAMLVVPGMGWITRIAPFSRGQIGRAIAINIAGAIAYTLLHSTFEILLRYPLQGLIGLHHSLLTMVSYTYVSEAPGDVVYYGFIITSLYSFRYFLATRDIETKLAQAQLENLRLQLQPHFLFNTLNAISSVMYEDVSKADRMLAQVSDYMRLVLASGGAQEISLEEELRMERMYVDIMKTRLDRNLVLDVRVADDARNVTVPFMLLQPLLENSIRHGMGSARTSIELGIEVTRSNGTTVIRVSDNGLGFDATRPCGIGLTNVAARLAYLYGSRANFNIASREGGGTLAVVSLPC